MIVEKVMSSNSASEPIKSASRRSMDSLPSEVLRPICNLLVKKDALTLCHVSKRFYAAAKERLYRSIVLVDHQYEFHLMTLKKFYNQNSFTATLLQSETSLDMLLKSLKYNNTDNQKLIKEFKCIVCVDSSALTMERKIKDLLSLDITFTALMVPIFKKNQLSFDASRLRWLSVGEMINSTYDRNTDEVTSIGNGRKLRAERLEMLHIRSCDENFATKIVQDIEGLSAVTSLRLTGTSADDDYQQYPNHLEEMANMFILSHNMAKLNNGEGFRFSNLKHLTIQKYQFAKSAYRKWSPQMDFLNLNKLESLALLNCKHDPPELQAAIQNHFAVCDFTELKQLVYEHSSLIHLSTLAKMTNVKRFHLSKGGLTFEEITRIVRKMKNLERFSMNDSKLMRDFHRIFNSHRESNVLFSRRFLNEYQFQPTQPIFKYTEEELNRLLSCYKISTDYIATNYDNDVDPFYDIYFNDQSFTNEFLKRIFRPFKEDIESKILPIADNLFHCNSSLKFLKICGIGFKRKGEDCYVDV